MEPCVSFYCDIFYLLRAKSGFDDFGFWVLLRTFYSGGVGVLVVTRRVWRKGGNEVRVGEGRKVRKYLLVVV